MADPDNDLEVLEELTDEADNPDQAPEEFNKSEISEKFTSPATNPFINSIFPVLFIDKKMKILFANKACENLFAGFFSLTGNYFMDIFGKAFEIDDIRKIRETIKEGKNGYTWKGKASIKSRNLATVQTKAYLYTLGYENREQNNFVIMFDDVTEENKKMQRSFFMSLLEASMFKDRDTGKHIARVNYYSKRMAEAIYQCKNPSYNRIDTDFIENIGFLASMHDVGKIGTPDDILNKEGPLNDNEWVIMREHTRSGAFILSTYPNPMAKEIALSHHEHWDGSGYPYQFSEEMIPLSARIVTIADVYDALRMERAYKPAFDHEIAVQKMKEGKNSHFDPFLLDIFLSISNDFREIFERNQDENA